MPALVGDTAMSSRRTVPVADNPDFRSLVARITPLMARWGFQLVEHKGSASWIATTKCQRFLLAGETIFKLTFYGPGDMAFGVRKSFAEEVGDLPKIVAWPLEFGVPPQSHVAFLGFDALNDAKTVERVHRLLKATGEPKPENQLPAGRGGSLREFDQQLDQLGE